MDSRREFLKYCFAASAAMATTYFAAEPLNFFTSILDQDYVRSRLRSVKEKLDLLPENDFRRRVYLGNVNSVQRLGVLPPHGILDSYFGRLVGPYHFTSVLDRKETALTILYYKKDRKHRTLIEKLEEEAKIKLKQVLPNVKISIDSRELQNGVEPILLPYKEEEEEEKGDEFHLSNRKKYLLLEEKQDVIGKANHFGNYGYFYFDDSLVRLFPNLVTVGGVHEIGHMYGLPHCFDDNCIMYPHISVASFRPDFNRRCSMIGLNLTNGKVVLEYQRLKFKSPKLVDVRTASDDLLDNLRKYIFSDSDFISRQISSDFVFEVHLEDEVDRVSIGSPSERIAELTIKNFIEEFKINGR